MTRQEVDEETAHRFWAKVRKGPDDDCWQWAGHTDDGYGRAVVGGRRRAAHRVAFTLTMGEIPGGMDLHHTCHNRACVNPGHLELRSADVASEATAKRFWSNVRIGAKGECWPWEGGKNTEGYGRFKVQEKLWMAHRFAYERCVGEIPAGHDLHHRCRNKPCVNPAHLEAVPISVHRRYPDSGAGLQSRKTHCKRGHPFDLSNTRLYDGRRYCRACVAERKRERLTNANTEHPSVAQGR